MFAYIKGNGEHIYHYFDVSSGLSNNSIYAITADENGLVWIGTDYGLNCYDGVSIKNFNNINNNVRDNFIRSLFCDSNGKLWIGTNRGGLTIYDADHDSFSHYYNNRAQQVLNNNGILSFCEDKNKDIWISTFTGVTKYNCFESSFERFTSNENKTNALSKLYSQTIWSITVDTTRNYLFLGAEKGKLYRYDLESEGLEELVIPFNKNISLENNDIKFLKVDKDRLWITTHNSGLWYFDLNKEEFEKIIIPGMNNNVNCCFPVGDDWLYVGSVNGLFSYNKKNGEYKVHNPTDSKGGDASYGVNTIFGDKDGGIWAGFYPKGVVYITDRLGFKIISNEDSEANRLSQNTVSLVYRDSKARLWVGYFTQGWDVLDGETFEEVKRFDTYNHLGSTWSGSVFSILEDYNGYFWIGSYNQGIQIISPNLNKYLNFKNEPDNINSIGSNDVRSIVQDKEGNYWFAVHGAGLDCYNPSTLSFTHYNSLNSNISNDWTFAIEIDEKNRIWIGTGDGLSLYNSESNSFETFLQQNDSSLILGRELIRTLTICNDGTLWLGTEAGLCQFDKEKKQVLGWYTARDGLPSSRICKIIEDDGGNLWVSTQKGLSFFNKENKTFYNYYEADGISSNMFVYNSGYKTADGTILFGSVDGITQFTSEDINFNSTPPNIVLTGISISNQPLKGWRHHIKMNKALVLDFNQNFIKFEYTALNFKQPDASSYSYKLDGIEDQWNDVKNKTEAIYTKLPPGEYLFQVKAANHEGIWNNEGLELPIVINPPFWLTIWAYALYFLIVVLIVGLIILSMYKRNMLKHKLALNHIENQQKEEMYMLKFRFFTNLSHEFRTPLTLIMGAVTQLRGSFNKIENSNIQFPIGLLSRNADRLLKLVNQLLDYRKIESGAETYNPSANDIVKFVGDTASLFNYLASEKNINYKISNSIPSLICMFDIDKMEKILINILSNAFKFTPVDGEVEVVLHLDNSNKNQKQLILEISDTAGGIPDMNKQLVFEPFQQLQKNSLKKQPGSGLGLSIVDEYTKMHNGNITINDNIINERVVGAVFRIVLPVKEFPLNDNFQYKERESLYPINRELVLSVDINSDFDDENSSDMPLLLIVDDNVDMLEYLKSELRSDFQVILAEDGSPAYEIAINQIPDMIISDVMMGEMTGIELCRLLKTNEKTSHIPVILLTALAEDEHHIEGLETGADDYLTKPFNIDILRSRISNIRKNREILQQKFRSGISLSTQSTVSNSVDKVFLDKAIQIIEQNIENPEYDIADFTLAMAMSRTQLYRKLKAISGQTVSEFIKTIRLKKAAELLLTENITVAEVVSKVGFSNQSFFSRSFTKQFKINPSKYAEVYSSKK